MASVSARNGRLYFDFRYQGVRCREYTALEDTRANRKRMQSLLDKVLAEITLGTFDYAEQFPGSPRARQFSRDALLSSGSTPLLREFATRWTEHKTIEWRQSYRESVANILETHVLPENAPDEAITAHHSASQGITEHRRASQRITTNHMTS